MSNLVASFFVSVDGVVEASEQWQRPSSRHVPPPGFGRRLGELVESGRRSKAVRFSLPAELPRYRPSGGR
jgi:hypothetical protein